MLDFRLLIVAINFCLTIKLILEVGIPHYDFSSEEMINILISYQTLFQVKWISCNDSVDSSTLSSNMG